MLYELGTKPDTATIRSEGETIEITILRIAFGNKIRRVPIMIPLGIREAYNATNINSCIVERCEKGTCQKLASQDK